MNDKPIYSELVAQLIKTQQLKIIPPHGRVKVSAICVALQGAELLKPVGSHFLAAESRLNTLWDLGNHRTLVNRAELAHEFGSSKNLDAALESATKVEPTTEGAIYLESVKNQTPRRGR